MKCALVVETAIISVNRQMSMAYMLIMSLYKSVTAWL